VEEVEETRQRQTQKRREEKREWCVCEKLGLLWLIFVSEQRGQRRKTHREGGRTSDSRKTNQACHIGGATPEG
jgi:hypothetical protein